MTQASFTKLHIRDAISQIERIFPFNNYITKGKKAAIEHIIRQIAKYKTDGKLLDIGCGPMDKTAVFQRLGFECCAADDLSDPWHRVENNLELILEFAQRADINFYLQSNQQFQTPFPQESFDIVTIFSVIEHLHVSPRNILNSAGSYLKDGGIICITMPNSANLRKRISVLFGSTNYPPIEQFFLNTGYWRGHVREYTLAETVYICKAMGFEVLSATAYEVFAYDKIPRPLLGLYLIVSGIVPTVRSSLCVIARKPIGWVPT